MDYITNENKRRLNAIDWDFKDSNKSPSIHSIHPYPAKYIPEIPRTLIREFSLPNGKAVLDPFCGSGVTLVEAQNAGFESYGIDLNPIACLISKVKTNHVPSKAIYVGLNIIKYAKKNIGKFKIPNIPNLDHWFKKDVQNALTALLHPIQKVKDETIKNIMLLCVSSIIVKVSNQDSDTRYAAVDKRINIYDVFKHFEESLKRIVKYGNKEGSVLPKTKILQRNILDFSTEEIDTPIGLVVTSPPYPNAYEYWLYHKYRMWWLGFDPNDVKQNEIGARAHYFRKNHQTSEDFVIQMDLIFSKLSELVIKNGKVIMVTGNSKIHGEIIDNESIIATAGLNNEFDLVDIVSRQMSQNRKAFNLSHARIKKEHLVILNRK